MSDKLKQLRDQICALLRVTAELKQLEIARAIFGPYVLEQQVTYALRLLLADGRLTRSGKGGSADPYRYSISDEPA